MGLDPVICITFAMLQTVEAMLFTQIRNEHSNSYISEGDRQNSILYNGNEVPPPIFGAAKPEYVHYGELEFDTIEIVKLLITLWPSSNAESVYH